ncbi:hypothetical protein EVAR_17659_1 [Eumeta japonica]|uniref:Uncharacterized protein n=1 Tax=Eumeta variegata TaxID=151549 RepID=A0A4C1UT06_EUMVA|nr:hypothetical protein EVAR_17659_1 [Eumeta japonica]
MHDDSLDNQSFRPSARQTERFMTHENDRRDTGVHISAANGVMNKHLVPTIGFRHVRSITVIDLRRVRLKPQRWAIYLKVQVLEYGPLLIETPLIVKAYPWNWKITRQSHRSPFRTFAADVGPTALTSRPIEPITSSEKLP